MKFGNKSNPITGVNNSITTRSSTIGFAKKKDFNNYYIASTITNWTGQRMSPITQ
jgi:hypothetical protein